MTQIESGKPTFSNLGISPKMLEQLETLRFIHPTPIQFKAIPAAIKGKDIIGIAQTGTGKTLAFSIPMIQRIASGEGKGLVILPTRELALQVEEEIRKIGRYFGLRTAVLIGGASMHQQIIALRRNPNVIIATPGRLIDHIDQKKVSLKDTKILVLDEADRMLDMGFEPQIKTILATVPSERQTLLFSATMPEKIASITKKYMKDPVRVEVTPAGSTLKKIKQEGYFVEKHDKIRLLAHLLSKDAGSMIVFTRTKFGAKKITQTLKQLRYGAAEIHSNRSLAQRRQALDGFRSGKYRVLVATDIAARGIDVTHIQYVVNYDLPEQSDDYVHRIGRTGRAGREGTAISFVTSQQKRDLRQIERLIRGTLDIKETPKLPELKIAHTEPHDAMPRGRRPFRGRGRTDKPYSKPYASRGRRDDAPRSNRKPGGFKKGRPQGGKRYDSRTPRRASTSPRQIRVSA